MKKFALVVLILGLMLATADFVLAQEEQVEIKFFYSETCHACKSMGDFLDELEKEYSGVKINRFVISKNIELLKEFYQEYEVPLSDYGVVPVVFVEDRYFIGYSKSITKNIEDYVLALTENAFPERINKGKITLPIIGEINIEKYSLPVLAILLGVLDGFNVCSLGALILILGLVLALRSRKKTLIFGGLFILTTAIVYGLLIVVWYKIFSFFVSYLRIMEILIGVLGIGGGIYFLREFIRFRKYGPTCEVGTGKGIIARFSSKFQQSFNKPGSILLLLASVLLFAGVITIVEFPCSAAVPVIFAGVLAQSQLPTFYYLLYIALFLLFYMLDEIIVFLVAFFTMRIWLASGKAVIWITLTEAIILFLLGFYYLFGNMI